MIELMLQAERALMVGMVDQAERLYLMASKNDPRNAIAVVGLARVALERNDDRAAYGLACDALAIDPDNAAALRLEARLSEVLQHRGEAVERPDFVQPGGPGTAAGDEAAGRRSKGEAPFPPARKVPGDGAGEGRGTVMRTERPGWQPAKMPDAVRPVAVVSADARPTSTAAKPWAPPGWSTQETAGPATVSPAASAHGAKPSPVATAAPPAAVETVAPAPVAATPVAPAPLATALGAAPAAVATEPATAPDEPVAIRIRPKLGASSGPTRYVAVTVSEEPAAAPAASLPGGVPASAMGQRPFAASVAAEAEAAEAEAAEAEAAAAPEPPRRSFLRRLFGR